MPQYPAYLFWVSDWINDCSTMEFIDQMMYRSLIDISWLRPTCALPDDHEWIRKRLSQVGVINGKAITKKFYDVHVRPIISMHFPPDERGEFRNQKLSKVRAKAMKISEKNSQNVSRRWESNETISKTRPIRPNEFGNANQSNPIQERDSEYGTSSESSSDRPSTSHQCDDVKNWNHDPDLKSVFEFGLSLCKQTSRAAMSDLDPWLRLGLEPADLRRAFERGIEWMRTKPDFRPPYSFESFRSFFQSEVTVKNNQPKTNVVPIVPAERFKTPAEVDAEWRVDPDKEVEEIRKHLEHNRLTGRNDSPRCFAIVKRGFRQEALRLALQRGIFTLEESRREDYLRLEPECTIFEKLTSQYLREVMQRDPNATLEQRVASYRPVDRNHMQGWIKPRLEAELADYRAKRKQAPVVH